MHEVIGQLIPDLANFHLPPAQAGNGSTFRLSAFFPPPFVAPFLIPRKQPKKSTHLEGEHCPNSRKTLCSEEGVKELP